MEDNTTMIINQGKEQRSAMPRMVIPNEIDRMTASETSTILWDPISNFGIQSIFERADLHAYGQNLPQFIPLGLND